MLGKLNKRQLLLCAALAATLIAVYFAPPKPAEEVVEANKIRTALLTSGTNPIEKPVKQDKSFVIKRFWSTEKSQNLFPSKIKPQPKVVILAPQVPLAPPKPIAPPLPFVYIGKVIEEGKPTVFVSKLQKNYFLKGGEVIEGMYKVNKVEPGQVVFTYLPLETEQIMNFGGKD